MHSGIIHQWVINTLFIIRHRRKNHWENQINTVHWTRLTAARQDIIKGLLEISGSNYRLLFLIPADIRAWMAFLFQCRSAESIVTQYGPQRIMSYAILYHPQAKKKKINQIEMFMLQIASSTTKLQTYLFSAVQDGKTLVHIINYHRLLKALEVL